MAHKKKYHIGSYILLLILSLLLLNTFSTCYASISTEFVDYAITTLDENGSWSSQNTAYHNALSHLTDAQKTSIAQSINSKLVDLGIGPYTEKNCIVLTGYFDSTTMELLWTFSNVSAGDDSLGYLQLWRNGNSDTFGAYNGTIYFINFHISYNSSSNSTNFNLYDSSSSIYANTKTFWPGSPTFTTLDNAYILTMSNIASGSASNQVWCTRPWQSGASMTYAFIHDKSENGGYVPPTPPEPEPPQDTTGTITNSSGETTGSIDLSGIQNGITDVKNQISGDTQNIINSLSGEVGKITNTLTEQPDLSQTEISQEQINNTIDFDFMVDPYANFWFEMTNGLSSALTGTVRQLPIDWLGYQGVFDLDKLGFNYPYSLRLILTSVSTVSIVWLLVKWWKIIVDKLTSGDMDEVLAMNEEERNCRLILRGCNND